MEELFVHRPPNTSESIAGRYAIDLPDSYHGKAVKWDASYHPQRVFIDSISLETRSMRFSLYGTRMNKKWMCGFKKDLDTDGSFLQFSVLVLAEDQERYEVLRQDRGVTYSSQGFVGVDWIPARKVSTADMRKLCELCSPDWKRSDALWPTHNGEPMHFVGQFFLAESPVTREFLDWGLSVFLFSTFDDAPVSKIVTQRTNYQTISEHYRSE